MRQRVQKLTESAAMQVVAVADPAQLGLARQAMLGVRVSGDAEAVAKKLSAMKEVDFLVATAGSYDLLAEVLAADDPDLLEVAGRVRKLDGVLSVETFVYLARRKQAYDWVS